MNVIAPSSAVANPVRVWSPQQSAFILWAVEGRGSCVLEAVAGAGKTTTLLEAAQRMPGQVAILAYNKDIGIELKAKLDALGVSWKKVQAGTVHSFGFKAMVKQFKSDVVPDKVRDLCDANYEEGTTEYIYRTSIMKLVSMAKNRAVGLIDSIDDTQAWLDIIETYDIIDSEDGTEAPVDVIIAAARAILVLSNKLVAKIDYDDMVYLPLIHKVRMWRFDNVIMDEAQDTNPVRRLFVRAILQPRGRAIFVGDSRQGIYMFTGADNGAMDICATDFNARRMPLTITYRCPKAVVRFAHQWVSHIEAAATAPEGAVVTRSLEAVLANPSELDADAAFLCRNTKPLVELFFTLLRSGVACRIEGRDAAESLIKLATRWSRVKTIVALEDKLTEYKEREIAKALKKGKEERVQNIEDIVGAVLAVAAKCRQDGKELVSDVVAYLDSMFGEKVKGMLVLSTIHKSKGREWKRVFWLDRAGLNPSKYAVTTDAQTQESNLQYVAATRAMETLIDVTVPPKPRMH